MRLVCIQYIQYYKHMTAISKNVYFDVLDDIVDV